MTIPTRSRPRYATRWRLALAAVATFSAHALGAGGTPSNPETGTGAALYERHCVGCHDSRMHIQGDRRTGSYAGVVGKVRYFSDLQGLQWTGQEIDHVASYLNGRYYHFWNPEVDDGGGR